MANSVGLFKYKKTKVLSIIQEIIKTIILKRGARVI